MGDLHDGYSLLVQSAEEFHNLLGLARVKVARRLVGQQERRLVNHGAGDSHQQLLAVNDHNIAVGFYTDGKGVNHGYSYNITSHKYSQIKVSGDTNVTAAGINNLGDVAGFATSSSGGTEGFLTQSDGNVIRLNFPRRGHEK